jgi:signal transduction histidine kinase
MRRRLLVSYLSVALTVLVILEVPLGVLSARRERDLLASSAERDAASLAVVVQEGVEHPQSDDLVSLTSRYRAQTGDEVAVVDRSGHILVRLNEAEPESVRSDLSPEVGKALGGRLASGSQQDEGHRVEVAAVPVRNETAVEGAVVIALRADAVDHRIALTWLGLGALALLVVAATSLVGLHLAGSVTGPLGRLEATAAALGHGDLSVRAAAAGPPEVRALASTFNEMAGRLEDLVGLQRRFVADASHQLRSPLTALRLRIENLELAADPGSAADVGAAAEEVARLSRIVDGLMALTSAEGLRPERAPVDVATVVSDRQAAWAALAEERGVLLRVDEASTGNTRAWAVPGHLEQILDNLLANAAEATPEGRSITMRLESADGRLALHVCDEGPGMSPPDRARAFDRLWQGSGNNGGSGLGLSIVRQLARSCGGDCELREAPGGGLDAIVDLPRA